MFTLASADDINAVSAQIWSSMVNIPLTLTDATAIVSHNPGRVISSVQIVGSWQGAVRLDMGTELARQATASLVGADPTEILHADICDAASELANMTAGGIKELLPVHCEISLPTVVMGTDFQFSVQQGVTVYRSVFETGFGPFMVTLIRGDGKHVCSRT
jgi:CheY-specific phosphatase CheX